MSVLFMSKKMKNLQILTLNKPNITDFSEVRNELLKNAKSDWVLFLDSDEVLSEALKKEIKNLDPKDYVSFYIKRKIIFLGKEIGEDHVSAERKERFTELVLIADLP